MIVAHVLHFNRLISSAFRILKFRCTLCIAQCSDEALIWVPPSGSTPSFYFEQVPNWTRAYQNRERALALLADQNLKLGSQNEINVILCSFVWLLIGCLRLQSSSSQAARFQAERSFELFLVVSCFFGSLCNDRSIWSRLRISNS